jgi:glycosyltransferase involved in cell wall biosynthesis
MLQRPKLLLLIPHLGGGGAERITSLLTRSLSPAKYDLHLGLITESTIPSDQVPAWVKVHALAAPRIRYAAIPLVRLVRRLRPDLILSGMAHLNFLVLLMSPLFPRRTRVVLRQNAIISANLKSGSPLYTRYFYRHLYPAADKVICQTQAMASELATQSGRFKSQLQVLANPVDIDSIRTFCPENEGPWRTEGPHLLACGRLSPEKGFDLLLESFVSLRLKFPSAKLIILGAGPDLAFLLSLRNRLRLEVSVEFAGHVAHPERFFPGTTLFVLSSRQDSLPNALLEAAAGGLPLVALPSSEGVVSLLTGKPGVWMGSEISSPALTSCLLAALASLAPGQRFPHTWVENFRLDSAIQGYERLIDELLQP